MDPLFPPNVTSYLTLDVFLTHCFFSAYDQIPLDLSLECPIIIRAWVLVSRIRKRTFYIAGVYSAVSARDSKLRWELGVYPWKNWGHWSLQLTPAFLSFGIPSARINLQKGIESIRITQSPEGGWTVSVSDNQPTSWATALAGFALLNLEGLISASGLAANFLLNAAQKTPRNWILKMAEWMQSWDSSYVDQNLRGWNWNSGTATWIEPTAYGLIFLKKFRSMGGGATMIEHIN